ncbi:cobyric acid synthase [Diaminobutyricimonas sp. TR449]|uniref:type 1 glutamine amidotransferase n=1 Tax=Diaminobutyricimonas sp. TR449 TaxID=2708076 RepID=UPI00141FE781|nr:cobyric acid synthase [Diaminobutyricimonas sp. TR449]
MTALNIVHLYPRELGINGDVGNVMALRYRAGARGIPAIVHAVEIGDPLPDDVDLVHIGSGPVSGQEAVHADLMERSGRLLELAASGAPFLGIAAGWQLLGQDIELADGSHVQGVGIFPSRVKLGVIRSVGEIVLRTRAGIVTGFENHSAVTTLQDGADSFGEVLYGKGNTPSAEQNRVEGVRTGASIGTSLHGPVLPMNPLIADELLLAALRVRQPGAELSDAQSLRELDDRAAKSREAIMQRRGVRAD